MNQCRLQWMLGRGNRQQRPPCPAASTNPTTPPHIFEQKYHAVTWLGRTMMLTPEAVVEAVIERVNRGAGIFLQPGFLQDVVVVSKVAGTASYYEDLRADYIRNSIFSQHKHYYTVSLEYGHFADDPFSVMRDPDPEKGHEAAYLHPVIRRYTYDTLVSEHHIQDDLENEWYHEEYVQPALAYFQSELTHISSHTDQEAELLLA